MGYHTDFTGGLEIFDKNGKEAKLDDKTANLIIKLSETRRMKRDSQKLATRLRISHEECIRLYGKEGEFYFHEDNDMGQTHTDDIVNFNYPPSTQPGLWCDWTYNYQDNVIEWNGSEKTYDSEEWINYISKILSPRGYTLRGNIYWFGEDRDDVGNINVNGSQSVNIIA